MSYILYSIDKDIYISKENTLINMLYNKGDIDKFIFIKWIEKTYIV